MKVWGLFVNQCLYGLYVSEDAARRVEVPLGCESYFIKELPVEGGDPTLMHYASLSRLNNLQSQIDLIKNCVLRLQDKIDGIKS